MCSKVVLPEESRVSDGGRPAPFSEVGERRRATAGWKAYPYRVIAREVSRVTRYCDGLIQVSPREEDSFALLGSIDCPEKHVVRDVDAVPDLSENWQRRHVLLFHGNFNFSFDIQKLLLDIKSKLSRSTRVVVVAYNPYLDFVFRLATSLGLRQGPVPSTFLTKTDLRNLARLAGFEVVRFRPVLFSPFRFLGLGALINMVMPTLPLLRSLGLAGVVVLRPVVSGPRPSLSVIVPARNEKGNIENAILRLPELGCDTEVIFVEGGSTDETWVEILRVREKYGSRVKIQAHQQTGRGKADAVRLGFARAEHELLTILDADLTMPPELLGRFYDAFADGKADFINGSRLLYPMKGDAMRFLNRLGNVFFAKALSYTLDMRISDSLCGTKLVARHDYQRMIRWRGDFGDFDPFGDFELIFAAAMLALGTVDVPIRYRDRTYGATNISRFRHGLMLLKMTLVGLFRIKVGAR